ncbi:MAG: hypothetical protein JWL81_227 [Verrucomicrobiales bacterium]|nr:hypothetical protein [Verrucomicrobiales bacterium]
MEFAPDEVGGQVLALSVDDAGKVFAAVTARAFGRGTVDPGEDAELLAQDRALLSLEQREHAVSRWLATGKLDGLLKMRAPFYKDAGDGPSNFLTKFSESVRWLKDDDGDGRATESVTVAGNFQDSLDGPGSALLALPGGRWLFGCAPRMWRLEDRNDDGRAEERTPLAGDFGLGNGPWGADLHALMEAPDGWIYFGMGERGYQIPAPEMPSAGAGSKSGQSRRRGIGSGAIFRCRPDGSGLEIIATGLRNPTGLAMTPDGRLMAMDQGAAGGKARLLLVIPGADFGWRAGASDEPGKGVWFDENMESASPRQAPSPDRPQWILPAVASVEGTASALEILPDGTLLAADARGGGKGGLWSMGLRPESSWLNMMEVQDVWRGGAVMALARDPGGAVYFADWGDAVDVHSRCRIRCLTWPAKLGAVDSKASEIITRRLPALAVRELKGMLEHASPRVRLRAGQRLEGMSFQDSLEALLQVARRGTTLSGRLQGLWGAATVARQDITLMNEIITFLTDPEPAVRAAAATLLGGGPKGIAPPALRKALRDESEPVRLAAAAALTACQAPDLLPDLVATAEANTTRDPFLRHSLAHAMASTVPARFLADTAHQAATPETRLTLIHALRRQAAPQSADFLTDSDVVVATEAARAIYDLPILSGFPALAALLDTPGPLPAATARRALEAAVYLGTPADSARVGAFAGEAKNDAGARLLALEILQNWDAAEALDSVWRRPRHNMSRLPGVGDAWLRSTVAALRQDADSTLAAKAAQIQETLKPAATPGQLLTLLNNSQSPDAERLAAWHRLAGTSELTPEAVKALTLPPAPESVRAEARAWMMRRDPKTAVLQMQDALAVGSVVEKQWAFRALDRLPGNGNDNEKYLLESARRLGAGLIEPGIQVEVLEALQRRDIESRSPWRRAWDAWMASLSMNVDPLAGWRMTMEHGDPAAGRMIFETNADAGCVTCHSVKGRGGISGPDLDGVADRLNDSLLLESLIHPSAKIAKGFEGAGGTKPDSTNSQEPARSVSPMPPVGTLLTLREIRDLMAWLRGLKRG